MWQTPGHILQERSNHADLGHKTWPKGIILGQKFWGEGRGLCPVDIDQDLTQITTSETEEKL